jgi:hypothetical protein
VVGIWVSDLGTKLDVFSSQCARLSKQPRMGHVLYIIVFLRDAALVYEESSSSVEYTGTHVRHGFPRIMDMRGVAPSLGRNSKARCIIDVSNHSPNTRRTR